MNIVIRLNIKITHYRHYIFLCFCTSMSLWLLFIIFFIRIINSIRINNHLLLFECKGTSAPIGEQGKYMKWVTKFIEQMGLLNFKSKILEYNIDKKVITEPFLKGVNDYILCEIKTEGILADWGLMTLKGYDKFLSELKLNIQNNTIESYFSSKSKFRNWLIR